ncbi:HmuY family protein [Spirosoma sp. KUDC1026]|uniref:HmuY family protein n=1 Tax=Spirosoma sp. KUDC1026 TaxID=2745947 RepID=UPI00159BE87E|nr:HmuY family protein [Spirosoma sp. KUDC1026]QKZ12163.1 HmuY family protein [Spirosoma sp. KUDC1026]
MLSLKNTLWIAALSLAALTSCSDDSTTPAVPVQSRTVRNLPADPTATPVSTTGTSTTATQPAAATNKYTLYRLSDSTVVANSDSASNRWDIGFRATNIIVNGGAIRSGQGGAYVHSGTFDALTTIPESATFATDQSASQLAVPTGSGNGWYNYANTIITPIPGRVLVVRTGDGKYAKVEILSYYRGAPATPSATSVGRYYTFRYVYQPNGSKTLN